MLYYLHIPKTGGQTLATRLAAAFPPNRSYVIRQNIDSAAQLQSLLPDHDFIAAHTSRGALEDAPAWLDILCTVRHPWHRLRSAWLHIRRHPVEPQHRPANILSFRRFMQHYADRFTNAQARGLVRALFTLPFQLADGAEDAWIAGRLEQALGRLRWLVPTEEIDDFCRWWPLETGQALEPEVPRVNVAPNEAPDDDITAFCQANPQLFGLDMFLWQEARRRYAEWRRRVAAAPVWPERDTARADCAFVGEDGSAVWLTANWYLPEAGEAGRTWWAGPRHRSRLLLRRTSGQRWLRFDIGVLLMVAPEQITLMAPGEIPLASHVASLADGRTTVSVELPPAAAEEGDLELLLQVPRVASLMEASEDGTDPARRSVALRNWRLE